MTVGRTDGGGGKWKIEQCSVRPETAINAESAVFTLSCFLKTFSFQMEITLTEIKIGTRPAETLLENLKLLCFKMMWSQWINSLSQATSISTVNDLFTAKTIW